MKKQQEEVGSFVKVPIDEKYHTYARIITGKYYAFYDCRTKQDLPMELIKGKPILFTIAVYANVIKKGRWKVIGYLPLEEALKEEPKMFVQDILDPRVVHIYHKGKMIPATIAECEGLESASVWEADHVESRLRDYYAGVSNIWVETLKLKRVDVN